MTDEGKAMLVAGTGATVGASGAVGAVAVAGIPGLSAVGITSGLATIGGIVGGGMAAGLVIATAAPMAVGAAAYGFYKRLSLKGNKIYGQHDFCNSKGTGRFKLPM